MPTAGKLFQTCRPWAQRVLPPNPHPHSWVGVTAQLGKGLLCTQTKDKRLIGGGGLEMGGEELKRMDLEAGPVVNPTK